MDNHRQRSVGGYIYGVSGIPHIIVFAPDGTILARDLRGNDLAAKVDELLAK